MLPPSMIFWLIFLWFPLLVHIGLIKKYRKVEGNSTALKGNIVFPKHLNHNLIHQERFYIKHTVYETLHIIHEVLYKALKLLYKINTNSYLTSRLKSLLFNFPEQKDLQITPVMFDNIVFNHKTEPYRFAIEIAKLILLNYHPNLNRGSNDVLALMFDMNQLWENFVYVSLRKFKSGKTNITAQNTRSFWNPYLGYRSKMKPDIVINPNQQNCVVLDTK